MTKLLEKAVAVIASLPEQEQDALASLILEELASEENWSRAFSQSNESLERLANEALAEYRAGKTKPLGF
ncbi:MAG: hypothetical protein AABZ02_10870 [Bacteroidota bacterium]